MDVGTSRLSIHLVVRTHDTRNIPINNTTLEWWLEGVVKVLLGNLLSQLDIITPFYEKCIYYEFQVMDCVFKFLTMALKWYRSTPFQLSRS